MPRGPGGGSRGLALPAGCRGAVAHSPPSCSCHIGRRGREHRVGPGTQGALLEGQSPFLRPLPPELCPRRLGRGCHTRPAFMRHLPFTGCSRGAGPTGGAGHRVFAHSRLTVSTTPRSRWRVSGPYQGSGRLRNLPKVTQLRSGGAGLVRRLGPLALAPVLSFPGARGPLFRPGPDEAAVTELSPPRGIPPRVLVTPSSVISRPGT